MKEFKLKGNCLLTHTGHKVATAKGSDIYDERNHKVGHVRGVGQACDFLPRLEPDHADCRGSGSRVGEQVPLSGKGKRVQIAPHPQGENPLRGADIPKIKCALLTAHSQPAAVG